MANTPSHPARFRRIFGQFPSVGPDRAPRVGDFKELEDPVGKRNEFEPVAVYMQSWPSGWVAVYGRAGAVVGVFVVKEFAGGILIAHRFRVPLLSPFRQRGRIPESCWNAIVAPYAGQVARIKRVAFDLVLRLRIRSVLVVLAPGALLPPFGSRYRDRTLGHSGN